MVLDRVKVKVQVDKAIAQFTASHILAEGQHVRFALVAGMA